ncbi:MAG TPA: glutamate--tRNA ligase family protein [Vicinamibacterales bacterium]|nr:glutamate--tRNA ligase family protein [Vicinamibacterales bacterium]
MMRTRFAPSPTGYLHIGHIVNAIYVWGMARERGGEVLLRIEDHDRQRSRPEYEAALLDDLDWLGFAPDIYSTDDFRRGPCQGRQGDREEIYRAALAELVELNLVYGCDCSRRQLESPVYPGTCRDRGLSLTGGVGWRVRMEGDDGDVLVRDRLGNWTYQWAVTVDDTVQHITHVIRGADLRDSTPRQIALARLLGRETPPEFLHHPLIMKSATQKVSKSEGDTGLRELRAAGWTAARLIGQAAMLVGLQPDATPIEPANVQHLFAARQ